MRSKAGRRTPPGGEQQSAAGGRPTDVTNRDLGQLTDREREVLINVGHGLADRELNLGESTAKTHVKRTLMKLALRDRVHAVVYAYETGLLAPGRYDG